MSHGKSILAIHIDDDFLNIVHLGQTAAGLQVYNWAAEGLEAGIVKDGLIVDEQTISEKIRDFVKAGRQKPRKAIMSLSCSTARLKPSEFPPQTDERLQKQVQEQISKYTLFGNEEIVFDYCTFEGAAASSDKRAVLEAVTTRRISDACLAVARQAKLDLIGIEPAILPVMKLIYDELAAESAGASMLLALDSISGCVSVFKDGLPRFCQNLSMGVKCLSAGEDNFAQLMDQIKPVVQFAHSLTKSHKLVLRIAASCSNEELGVIAEQIKHSYSDITVEPIDSANLTTQFNIKHTDRQELPIFAFASALTALGACEFGGELNLVSQQSFARQRARKQMSLTAKAIAVVVLLSVVARIGLNAKIGSVRAASAVIETKVAETVPLKQEISRLRKQIKQLEEKRSAYAMATQSLTDIPWPKALRVIADSVPDKVRIVDISTTDSAEFTVIGEARAESYVYRFAKKLQDNKLLKSAKVEEIEYDDDATENLVDYKISCKIQRSETNP